MAFPVVPTFAVKIKSDNNSLTKLIVPAIVTLSELLCEINLEPLGKLMIPWVVIRFTATNILSISSTLI